MGWRTRAWRLARLGELCARDAFDAVTLRRKPMTPSRVANEAIGGHDFHAIGEELASVVRTLGGLQPDERVLDAGCGYGRLAVPLTRYLTTGEYAGFDIDRRAIRWCRREISSRFPNFWFAHADVANSHYNPRGARTPETFTFPCAGRSVDVVVATSLFTHLLPSAAMRYISETARVLKPGGRAVLTFFVFDDAARLREPFAHPHFVAPYCAVSDRDDPELGVAYELGALREAFERAGLRLERVARGAWSLEQDALTYQDVLVVTA